MKWESQGRSEAAVEQGGWGVAEEAGWRREWREEEEEEG